MEVPLFDQNAFREAIINAFVHNVWIDGNAPMITIYSNRIEILSRGTLAPKQTLEGFFLGESVPVITQVYGKEAFGFRENSIVVTIPFEKILPDVGDKEKNLNPTYELILREMRNNPNITQPQLMEIAGIGKTAIQNNISFLRKNGYIKRIGSNKNGYWQVL